MIAGQDLRFVRGQDLTLRFTMQPPRSVTGWTVTFTVREKFSRTVRISKSATLTDATRGVLTVSLARADTVDLMLSELLTTGEQYVWDLKRTNTGSNVVLARGPLTLEVDVT